MSDTALPLLLEDRSSIDWTHARYQAEIKIQGRTAIATHRLTDAPQLEELIQAGMARWVVELHCPKTLLAQVTHSGDATVRCSWDRADVDGELFLTPGLISIAPCVLRVDGLNELWGDEPIDVPIGRWLVRGQVLRTQSLASSLLEFHPDPDLQDGQMRVEPETSGGDLRFMAWVSPNYFSGVIQNNRDVQIAALIAAFGRIPLIDHDDEDGEGYAILTHIKAALEDAGVPVWGGELNAEFDPARAATAIEAFQIPTAEGD